MARWMATLVFGSLCVIGCGRGEDEAAGSVSQEVKACPFLVPFCPDECHLDNACPPRCHCPPAFTACGATFCTPNEHCCCPGACHEDGVGNFCAPLNQQCPISRRDYKTDINYLGERDLVRMRDELMQFRLATWRYKTEATQAPGHLGFMIDDVEPSPAVTGATGDSVDLYGYTSMAVATVQLQQQQIDELRGELKALKAELAKRSRAR